MPQPSAIALDATLWDQPTTGIGRYARCLAEALEREGVRVALIGASGSGDAPRGPGVGATGFVVGRLPEILAGREEPLFHAVGNFNLPLTKVPPKRFVLTVHDLIPELLPDTVSFAYRTQFRVWLARSLKVADHVLCPSQTTARDLRRLHPELKPPISVVPHGVDHVERGRDDAGAEGWFRSLELPPDYVLYAGALDARKNVGLLLDAAEALFREGKKLTVVLVGQRWFGSEPVERRIDSLRRLGVDLRPLGHQPEPRLYRLMRGAGAFVFPSQYEGFGLPPLEAMRLGAPVVVSHAGALPEVLGEPAVQVSPQDASEMAKVLVRLLGSPEERKVRSEAGKRHAQKLTWKRAAQKTLAAYEEALR